MAASKTLTRLAGDPTLDIVGLFEEVFVCHEIAGETASQGLGGDARFVERAMRCSW
jgi:hypothetical protein